AAVCTVYACTANAAVFTWDGGGADNNWQTAANWVGDIAPDSDGTASLVFAGVRQKRPPTTFLQAPPLPVSRSTTPLRSLSRATISR
ncbi:MAG TPA: hypothetical protein P5527_07355, partial [Kiritimatiellia bacterium]|nr:hypothetical protein [Kiritimatiellia bacterium]